jgi:hypothetical protein
MVSNEYGFIHKSFLLVLAYWKYCFLLCQADASPLAAESLYLTLPFVKSKSESVRWLKAVATMSNATLHLSRGIKTLLHPIRFTVHNHSVICKQTCKSQQLLLQNFKPNWFGIGIGLTQFSKWNYEVNALGNLLKRPVECFQKSELVKLEVA